jgi:trimeric autotransporter adhesin
VVDSAGDTVVEGAGSGTDLVQSGVDWALGNNVENLTLTGLSAIVGTGNAVNNAIAGNAADNLLDGGPGNDSLTGGAGSDTYVVDAAGDSIVEGAGAGTDLVKSSVNWTLGNNLENLTLTGIAAINGTGNGLVNELRGNAAANTLNGGAGNDLLLGGSGDDVYVVDSAGDSVIESPGEVSI